MKGGAVLIGVGDTAGAYHSVFGGADHRLWLSPRRDLCQDVCLELALRDGRHFDGQPSLSGHCGHGWTCSLPRPVAIDTRQPQDGTVKKGLHRPRLSAIIPNLTAAGSHPDCRAVLIQIVALHPIDQAVLALPHVGSIRPSAMIPSSGYPQLIVG